MGNTNLEEQKSMQITSRDLEALKEELLTEIRSLLYAKITYPKRWLKTRDVIKLLNTCSGKLQTLRKSKKLPYVKLGGDMYYDIEDIEAMMQKYKVG
ncbi:MULTISPECIES: helix-turn-helix domain-containing protein [Sphingobacterium]|uniref:helix-turn-helix domain-containing protein n=1 Tax=Sphingobacterium TaxID=28453 RepID=UPI0008A19189|nr:MULTISPECIES: helix-turn-helix domain-containing protein [Sphingobacterium]MBB1642787.1 hypothetical protein [Sphingobacterium sp. UME9]OFV19525.1 hypothetical protein HMPREF3127_04715 [Sphingobacterium sp. HMSC13C05]HAL51259.1 DNA-binding protein [Sphingobacterium sp.]